MKKSELKPIITLALSNTDLPAYLSEEMAVFEGCAGDTKRRFVTKEQVASLIRGSCVRFDGSMDYIELEYIEKYAKRFDLV